jgi:hypothetical protein
MQLLPTKRFAMTNCNTDNKNLSILNLNIRSIANMFNTFGNLLSTLKKPFSIISLLTETWLNDQNSEIPILLILILFAQTELVKRAVE